MPSVPGDIYLLNEHEAAVPGLRAMAWYSHGEFSSCLL